MAEVEYKIKRIQFFGRSATPIFMQNENGPCPLLALANVLSLRNQLPEPLSGVTSISEKRLIAMVAERLVDSNLGSAATGSTSAYAADLQKNLSDSLDSLHKLAVGMDVNVRFDSVFGFEPTQYVSIFDLLDISLCHGWLVDPDDEETMKVVGSRSYNDLIEMIITTLDTTQLQLQQPPPPPLPPKQQEQHQVLEPGVSLPVHCYSAPSAELLPPQDVGTAMVGAAGRSPTAAAAVPSPQFETHVRSAEGHPAVSMETLETSQANTEDDLTGAAAASEVSLPNDNGWGSGTAEAAEAPVAAAVATRTKSAEEAAGGAAVRLSDAGTAVAEVPPIACQPLPHGAVALKHQPTVASGVYARNSTLQPLPSSPPSASPLLQLMELQPPSPAPQRDLITFDDDDDDVIGNSGEKETQAAGIAAAFANAAAAPAATAAFGQPAPMLDLAALLDGPSLPLPSPRAQEESQPPPPPTPPPPPPPPSPPPPLSAAVSTAAVPAAGAAATPGPSSAPTRPLPSAMDHDADSFARRAYEAMVAKDFLDSTCSQLTLAGLRALQSHLRPSQLAVFFRNNHFGVVFKHSTTHLVYLLVTDQGYLNEPDVVWEQLSSVDGDTQFCGADFSPFRPHREPVIGCSAAVEADVPMSEADAAAIAAVLAEDEAQMQRQDTTLPLLEEVNMDQNAPSASRWQSLGQLPGDMAAAPRSMQPILPSQPRQHQEQLWEQHERQLQPPQRPDLQPPLYQPQQTPGLVYPPPVPPHLQQHHDLDADLALALRLQQEEEEALRQEQEQRRQHQQQQQQHLSPHPHPHTQLQQQRQGVTSTSTARTATATAAATATAGGGYRGGTYTPAYHQQQQQQQQQRRPSSTSRDGQHPSGEKEKCIVM